MRSAITFALRLLDADDFYFKGPRFLQYSHYPETKPPKGKIQGLGQIHMRRHKKSKRRESKGAWK